MFIVDGKFLLVLFPLGVCTVCKPRLCFFFAFRSILVRCIRKCTKSSIILSFKSHDDLISNIYLMPLKLLVDQNGIGYGKTLADEKKHL
jgi:hypothetical protein